MSEAVVLEIAELEEQQPGWHQLQRCSGAWLTKRVREGDLKTYDLGVWLAISSRATTNTGVFHGTVAQLASDLGCSGWMRVALSIRRLQSAGALVRIRRGEIRVNPALLRAGGVGTHHQLFASWFDAVDKRVEDLTAKRAAKAAYDRERNARLKAERQAQEPQPA